jgi:hypothetical protein
VPSTTRNGKPLKVQQIHLGNDYSIDVTVEEGEEITEYDPLRNTTMSIKEALELYEKLGQALGVESR